MTSLAELFDRLVARLRARLAAGAATCGEGSFTRPDIEPLDELGQEPDGAGGNDAT